MGWFPQRDSNNKVLPENLYFPRTSMDGGRWVGGPRYIFQTQFGVGKENRGPRTPHYTKLLAEQALSFGWLNGVRIGKRRR